MIAWNYSNIYKQRGQTHPKKQRHKTSLPQPISKCSHCRRGFMHMRIRWMCFLITSPRKSCEVSPPDKMIDRSCLMLIFSNVDLIAASLSSRIFSSWLGLVKANSSSSSNTCWWRFNSTALRRIIGAIKEARCSGVRAFITDLPRLSKCGGLSWKPWQNLHRRPCAQFPLGK